MENIIIVPRIPTDAYARFLRGVGDAHLALAREIEALPADAEPRPAHALGLGSLQQSVFDVLAGVDEAGLSPREITRQLDRNDEPNVRTTLDSLRKKGVTELVSAHAPQRWRLTEPYRLSARGE